jgi:hypothetical protein
MSSRQGVIALIAAWLATVVAACITAIASVTVASAASPKPHGHYTATTRNGIRISLRVSPRAKTIRAAVTCRGAHFPVKSQWMTIRHGRFVGAARPAGAPPSVGPEYAISGRFRSRSKITGLLFNDAVCNRSQKRYTARLAAR